MVKIGIKVQFGYNSQIGVMSYQLRVSLYMVIQHLISVSVVVDTQGLLLRNFVIIIGETPADNASTVFWHYGKINKIKKYT